MIYTVIEIVNILLQVLWWIIIAQVIISWLVAFNVVNMQSDFMRTLTHALDRITEPLYRPIRKIMPDFGGLDFTPMVILILIYIIQSAVLPGIVAELGPTAFR